MPSIQENLARVRAGVATYESTRQETPSRVDAEVDHERILADHEEAIREHERQMSAHRESLERHKRRRSAKDDKDESRKAPRTRFRFKDSGHRHRSKRSGHDTSERSDDRSKRASNSQKYDEHREDHDGLDAYSAHPFTRPKASSRLLDPTEDESVRSQRDRYSRDQSANQETADLDPDIAFRTSLFDALEDDEGAATYWEAVYGDPIHHYARPKVASEERPGELEAMNDDEYAEYVKRKMWERKNPHLVREMRLRQEKEREQVEEELRRKSRKHRTEREHNTHDTAFMRDVDEALARGSKRKEAKRWREVWTAYTARWQQLEENVRDKTLAGDALLRAIPWPVEGATFTAVNKDDVRDFFLKTPLEEGQTRAMRLKSERFRWHPDKIQHRFGGSNVDADALQVVTSIFQTIDELLAAERNKS